MSDPCRYCACSPCHARCTHTIVQTLTAYLEASGWIQGEDGYWRETCEPFGAGWLLEAVDIQLVADGALSS